MNATFKLPLNAVAFALQKTPAEIISTPGIEQQGDNITLSSVQNPSYIHRAVASLATLNSTSGDFELNDRIAEAAKLPQGHLDEINKDLQAFAKNDSKVQELRGKEKSAANKSRLSLYAGSAASLGGALLLIKAGVMASIPMAVGLVGWAICRGVSDHFEKKENGLKAEQNSLIQAKRTDLFMDAAKRYAKQARQFFAVNP